jgi:hypothetical protein
MDGVDTVYGVRGKAGSVRARGWGLHKEEAESRKKVVD